MGRAGGLRDTLRVSDLSIGMPLVRAHRYGFRDEAVLTTYTVAKITKTRLTLDPVAGNNPLVVMLDGEKITDKIYGSSKSYRNRVSLFTTDDPELADIRTQSEIAALRTTAHLRVDEWVKDRDSIDKAVIAIEALKSYADASRAASKDEDAE